MKNELFNKLNSINVNVYTQEKQGLTYLNWGSAFRILEQHVDSLEYRVLEDNGMPFWDTPLGIFVKTEMTVNGETKSMVLPVLDFKNNPMYSTPGKVVRFGKEQDRAVATAFDVNSSIMRCFVKNIAMFGLGLYIYEGFKAPETSQEVSAKVVDSKTLEQEKKKQLWADFNKVLKSKGIVVDDFLSHFNIDKKDKEGLLFFVEDNMVDKELLELNIKQFKGE